MQRFSLGFSYPCRLWLAGLFCLFAIGVCPSQPVQAGGAVSQLNTSTFAQAISSAANPVLVEFKAKWCPYCKKQQPYLESLAQQRQGQLEVYQVDIDEDPAVAHDYDAHVLPTLVIIYQGNVVGRSEGALYGNELTSWIADVEADIRKRGQDTALPATSDL